MDRRALLLPLLSAVALGCSVEASPAPAPTNVAAAAPAPASASASAPAPASASAAAPAPAPEPPPEGMIALPPAIYLMGSRALEGLPEEKPMHEVVLAGFYLDRTEVTVRAYRACVAAGACTPSHTGEAFCPGDAEGKADHPISCIDFPQAEAYCAFAKKRLPTEREWEYAARAGNEHRKFSWGDDPPDEKHACYDHPGTCPVASFPAGAFGLYDMSGNVWEWTSTVYGPYPDEARAGTHRVYRGGSWSRRFPKWLRTALRNRYEPHKWSASLGVRCAKSQTPLTCPPDTEARGETCVRVKGDPSCEPGLSWNGKACSLGGVALPVSAEAAANPTATAAASSSPAAEPAPVRRTRTPRFDDDCKAHYAGRPAAYRYEGGTFYSRNPVIAGDGCTKRDMGETWTSACCSG
ncbi:SUMF1/EgtB/PvdO family nonheme iron enzyme [Polyangium sp. 6x1]|uniref:formylglycine-generating enzyme family protein n=1 Tax=Polyangium sp. 6x1 TaxID=3042689 RepID=UPI002482C1D6|nr:SUMF1/EgtB/PvdO family nonheme iron enzyme [Polyangium sp. 6x1]MDI1444414.1 SUMF1/EgtB/PvdO family nonheme iron enzyme [Polyangium sp. 6x1]